MFTITQERLKELMDYGLSTGCFYCKTGSKTGQKADSMDKRDGKMGFHVL
jgi:hypothetical protein